MTHRVNRTVIKRLLIPFRCHQRISSMSCWVEYHLSVVTSESAQGAAERNIISPLSPVNQLNKLLGGISSSIVTSELAQ